MWVNLFIEKIYNVAEKKNKTKKFPTDKIKNFLLVSSPIFEIIFKKSFAAAVERKKRKREKTNIFPPTRNLLLVAFLFFV